MAPPTVTAPLPFETYFVPYGPGAWAPYQPLTLNHHVTTPLQAQSTDQIFRSQELPFNLLVLSEKDKLAIAFSFEERSILLAEAEIAK